MKHRHNGRYWSRTPKGRYVTKQKPLHSQSLMRKYKNKPYPYLRRRFRISKMGDDDKDKVVNYLDCRPWDRKRQDLFLGEPDTPTARMYVESEEPENIYIGNWPKEAGSKYAKDLTSEEQIDDLAELMTHEELHNLLRKEISDESSSKLDLITVPKFWMDGVLLNPKTGSKLMFWHEAREAVFDEVYPKLVPEAEKELRDWILELRERAIKSVEKDLNETQA